MWLSSNSVLHGVDVTSAQLMWLKPFASMSGLCIIYYNITFFWTWVVIIAPVVLRIEWPIFRGVSKVGIDDHLKGWSTRMIPLFGLGKHQELGWNSHKTWPNLLGSCQYSMVNIGSSSSHLIRIKTMIFPVKTTVEQPQKMWHSWSLAPWRSAWRWSWWSGSCSCSHFWV